MRDPVDTIAAGPGFPFPAGFVPDEIRRCKPCGIETTEFDCFGCGGKTESFVTKSIVTPSYVFDEWYD